MASDINRVDVLSDELVAAPLKLAKDFDTLYISINKVKDVGKSAEGIAQVATSTADLAKATKDLAGQQTELDKVTKQFVTSTQRLSDEYVSNKRALNAVNEEVKSKIALGDKDSKTINAQNASYNQLNAALQKNRKAYQDLTTESQRSSKQGQELLKIIQSQDKEFKQLSDDMKITQVHVGDYGKALSSLDGLTGGLVSSFKNLGAQLAALSTNPFILIAAGLVATFEALKDAADAFYTRTLEGEEALREEQFKDEAFAASYEKKWAESGEKVAGTFSKLKNVWRDYISLLTTGYNFKALNEARKASDDAVEAAKKANELFILHAQDRVDDANTELKSNAALAESKNKLGHSDEQRLAFLRKSNDLLKEQLAGDLELADKDIEAYRLQLASLGKIVDTKKLISEMSPAEIKATQLNEAEILKLTGLQEFRLKLESAAAEKRAGFYKAEAKLINEMRIEAQNAAKERERQAKDDEKLMEQMTDEQKREFEEAKKGEDEEIKNKKKNDDEIVASNERAYNTMITDITSYYENLNKKEDDKKKKTLQDIADEEEARKRLIKTLQDYADVGADAAMIAIHYQNAVSQNKVQNYQTELAALNDQTAKEIQAAGDNEAAKDKIQRDAYVKAAALQKKINEEKNKQARLQHDADVIQAGVTFAKALLVSLAGASAPFNLTLEAITAAVAGVQLAAIINSPVPHYEKGTKSAVGGLSIVGERGSELIKEVGKPWSLSPDSATMVNLTKHAEVVPHDETMRRLALASMVNGELNDRQSNFSADLDDRRIVHELQQLRESMPDVVAQGAELMKVIKSKEGNKKWIRAQIFGY